MRRCLAIPLRGFGRILRAADTILIHAAKPKLAPGFPLLGRCPVPFQRLAIVLGNTLPLLVHAAKALLINDRDIVLRPDIALNGKGHELLVRRTIIAFSGSGLPGLEIRPGSRGTQNNQG